MASIEPVVQTLGDPNGVFEVYPVMEFKGFPAHRHHFYEIAYFAKGTGRLRYNGRSLKIQPPQLHICPPHRAWHEIDCRGAEIWTASIAVYPRLLPKGIAQAEPAREQVIDSSDPGVVLEYLTVASSPLIRLSPSAAARANAIIEVMCEESRLRLAGHVMRCLACVQELLVLALREQEGTHHRGDRSTAGDTDEAGGISRVPHVSNAIALMRNNFRRVLPNDELAGLVGLDAKYFARLFKREVGLTPQRYYLRLRLDAAAHQLVHSRLSIKQITAMFGFKSRSHFQNQFTRRFGSSPGVYRYYRRPAE